MSLGASASNAKSQNTSDATSQSIQSSQSQSNSGQSIAFGDIFSQLYGNATSAAGRAVAGAQELGATARQLFTGGSDFLSNLGKDAGTSYLTDQLGNNDVQDAQLNTLREQTGRLFSENINPAITSRNVTGGTLGGSRQGVAQALGAGTAADAFTAGATQILSNNQQQKNAAATTIAQNSLSGASTGLGALPNLLNLATQGNNSELGIYGVLSQILGGPTTLTSSNSVANSLAQAFSQASSQGTSKSSSYGVSVGV
jgi:hypothetical protein